MNTLQIILTGQAGIGWNFAVLRDGKPLPAEDPQDLPSAGRALQAALQAAQASVRTPHQGEGSE